MASSKRKRVFGVVVPVPPELSRLADRVRRSYDPNFPLIGPHVTVLPPRRLGCTRQEVVEAVSRIAKRFSPLRLQLGRIGTFEPVMPVVYAGFSHGGKPLVRLHRMLARGPLRGEETFPYVPHLTLGQNLDDGRLRGALALSRKIFSRAAVRAPWLADRLIIVERRSTRRWIPLDPVRISSSRGRRAPLKRRTGAK